MSSFLMSRIGKLLHDFVFNCNDILIIKNNVYFCCFELVVYIVLYYKVYKCVITYLTF